MVKKSLTDVVVEVENTVLAIVPNTLTINEGLGEQDIFSQSVGGGVTEPVYEDNAENNISSVKFSLRPTADNIEFIKNIKQRNKRGTATTVSLFDPTTGLTRTQQQSFLTMNYDVNLQFDAPFEVEFKGSPLV